MLRLPTYLTVAIALICSTATADAINARILKDHILLNIGVSEAYPIGKR